MNAEFYLWKEGGEEGPFTAGANGADVGARPP